MDISNSQRVKINKTCIGRVSSRDFVSYYLGRFITIRIHEEKTNLLYDHSKQKDQGERHVFKLNSIEETNSPSNVKKRPSLPITYTKLQLLDDSP